MPRPLLLGMNNPLSDDPEYDLYPYPERSTGWRIWKMLPEGTTRGQYLAAFDRRDLLRDRRWSLPAARDAAPGVLPDLEGRFVVVLGTQVRSALGLAQSEPLRVHTTPQPGFGFDLTWLAFPHPSGRNLWYNEPSNREAACRVLARLMRGELPL